MKKLLALGLLSMGVAHAEVVTMKAEPQPNHCTPALTCNVASLHGITIENTWPVQRSYNVLYQICTDNGDCKKHEYVVPIAPHDTWRHQHLLNLFTKFNVARTHQSTVITQVTSPTYNNQMAVNGTVDVR
jgi:hypothetical protein